MVIAGVLVSTAHVQAYRREGIQSQRLLAGLKLSPDMNDEKSTLLLAMHCA